MSLTPPLPFFFKQRNRYPKSWDLTLDRFQYRRNPVTPFLPFQTEVPKEETPSKVNPARVSDQKYVELPEGCDVHEEKTIVYLRIVFIKVKEVDTVKEVYTAKAYIQVSKVQGRKMYFSKIFVSLHLLSLSHLIQHIAYSAHILIHINLLYRYNNYSVLQHILAIHFLKVF